jgi:uncharacterized membrane protein
MMIMITRLHLIVARMFLILSLGLLLGACSRQPVYPSPVISGRDAVIDTSSLKPETPQFYTYRFQGKNISFFVIRLNNRIVSFFDACASCYPHKQGYRCENGSLVCRACGLKFSAYKLEKGLGGCYPIRIAGRMDKGNYLIPLASLEAEAGKF